MTAFGVIAEYNPFHNGHLYLLRQARRESGLDACVCVMSGHFTQRGEITALDKWSRAAAAAACGADLVLELPAVFAVRSAQPFATGAVRLLASLGVVEALAFGAETADAALLGSVAAALDADETACRLRQQLRAGLSYAAALTEAVRAAVPVSAETLAAPNNILGIEYLRALKKYASGIHPLPIRRTGAAHHDAALAGPIASATAIRRALQSAAPDRAALAAALPPPSFEALAPLLAAPEMRCDQRRLDRTLLALLRTADAAALANNPEISEGLERKFLAAALASATVEELLFKVKSRRYPLTRLRRILVHLLLGTTRGQLQAFDRSGPLYARVLAFNDRGRALLRTIKKTSALPPLLRAAELLDTGSRSGARALSPAARMLAADTYATDLRALCFDPVQPGALDFTTSPTYVRTS